MKLNANTKKILKIATVSALALLEIYLIYAAVASMTTYHQHPRFVSDDGQVAQSSGYRTQFFLCLAFAIAIPIGAGVLSYFFWFRKPKAAAVAPVASAGELIADEPASELAATADASQDKAVICGLDGAEENSMTPLPH